MARFGKGFLIWYVLARLDAVMFGKGFMVRRGGAEYCSVGHGVVRVSWSGLARQGVARLSLEWYGFLG